MKRDEVKAIFANATDEQIDAIMKANGSDIEREKGKANSLETELNEAKANLAEITKQLEALKQSNATADEWKSKFEALKADADAKEAERAQKEEQAKTAERFSNAVGSKQFAHEAIKADYLKRFADALKKDEYKGKSDVDIVESLTKDDANAFVGVKAVKIAGGANKSFEELDDAKVRAVMGLPVNK